MNIVELVKKDPATLSKKQLVSLARCNKDVISLFNDPWNNPNLIHPDTYDLKQRILGHTLLRKKYRPDLYDKYQKSPVPEEATIKAFDECTNGLDESVVERMAQSVGVSWSRRPKNDIMDHICVALFCKLTQMDVPYVGPPKAEATAWLTNPGI
jgi:hypothetical protein